MPRLDVSPTVTDHETAREVYTILLSSVAQQPRLGLAALTSFGVVVIADKDVINGQAFANISVHLLYNRLIDSAASDVRLIRHDN